MAKGSLRVNGIIVDTDGEIKASTGDSIVIREDDGSAVITVDTNGKTSIGGPMDVGVDDTGHDVKFFGATAGAYMLWDESQDDLIIGGAGRVGIGTTAPDQLLVSAGTGNVINKIEAFTTTAAQGPSLILARSNNGTLGSQTAVDAEDLLGGVYFQGSSGTAFATGPNILAYADETWSGTASGSTLRFYTTDNTTTTSDERMRIDHNGRVGIGTNNPYGALNVSDPSGTTTVIISDPTENDSGEHWYFRNTGGNFYIGQSTDGTGAWDSLAARMTFSDGGKVGIGAGVATQGALTVARSDFSSYSDAVTNPTGQALTIAADYTNGRYTGIYSVYTSSNNATKTKFAHWITTDTTNGITANWSTTSNYANGVTRNDLTIDPSGSVITPNQPAFQAGLNSTKTSGTDFTSTHDIPFNNEIFDNQSNYNNSNYTFTAPVTGRYQINVLLYCLHIPAEDGYIECQVISSNRAYYIIFDPNGQDATSTYHTFGMPVVADMDANDTVKCTIVYSISAGFQLSSACLFSACLVA